MTLFANRMTLILALALPVSLNAQLQDPPAQLYPFQKPDGCWTYHTELGKPAGEFFFDSVTEFLYFQNGLAKIAENGKWGVINAHGKMIHAPEFDELKDTYNAYGTSDGYFLAVKYDQKGNKVYGLTGKTGKTIIPCQYAKIVRQDIRSRPYFRAYSDSSLPTYFLYSASGLAAHMLFDDRFLSIADLHKRSDVPTFVYATVRYSDASTVYTDEKYFPEASILNTRLQGIRTECTAAFLQKGETLFSSDGILLFPPGLYTYHRSTVNNFFDILDKNGRWGLLDPEGNMVVRPTLAEPVIYFDKHLGGISGANSKVFLDSNGIAYSFGNLEPVSFAFAKEGVQQFIVKDNMRQGVMDAKGKIIIPTKWDELSLYRSVEEKRSYYIAKKEGKTAMFGLDGKCFFSARARVKPLSNSIWLLERDKNSTDVYDIFQRKYLLKGLKGVQYSGNEKVYLLPDKISAEPFLLSVYIPGSGWGILNDSGDYVIAPEHENLVVPIIDSTGMIGYSYGISKEGIEKKSYGVHLYNGAEISPVYTSYLQVRNAIGVITGLNESGNIDLYSFSGNLLTSFQFFDVRSKYLVAANAKGTNFYKLGDTLFTPLFSTYFEDIDFLTDNVFIGKKSGRNYVVIPSKSLDVQYDAIRKSKSFILVKRGDITDIYSTEGDLLVSNSTSLTEHDTYMRIETKEMNFWYTYTGLLYAKQEK